MVDSYVLASVVWMTAQLVWFLGNQSIMNYYTLAVNPSVFGPNKKREWGIHMHTLLSLDRPRYV